MKPSIRSLLLLLLVLLGLPGCASAQTIALVGGTVFTDPASRPIEDAVVLLDGERIVAVGPRGNVAIPPTARVVDVTGKSVMAGFWNSHVHFTEPKWEDAASRDAGALSTALRDMLLSRGFVRVVDTGSFLQNTLALRERIRSGAVIGPEIRTAGMPFVPPNGNPFYVEPMKAPELTSPEQAREVVGAQLAAGADLVKVFSGSPVAPGRTTLMPLDVLRAAVAVAHAQGRLVVAHPTTNEGLRRALDGGVDILAHTTPDGGQPWSAGLVADMKSAGMSVIPTLTLWRWALRQQGASEQDIAQLVALAQTQLRSYAAAGGSILFGTDVGFMTDYDVTFEYEAMAGAGLDFAAILRSLTTEPARRFGVADAGVIAQGKRADLVVVNGRPDRDVRALADVALVYLSGRVVFER